MKPPMKPLGGDFAAIRRHRRLRILGAIFLVAAWVYWLDARGGIDYAGDAIGGDFVQFWIAAKLAISQRWMDIVDLDAFLAAQREALGPDYVQMHIWSYPPTMLLLVWPLGFLGEIPAYAAWTLAGLAVFLLGARNLGFDRAGLLTLAVSPAVSMNAIAGQTGTLVAGLMFAGLGLSRARPILAGLLIGLCTVKPQLGLLIPIALVLTARWRCFVVSIATGIALFALSVYCFGWQIWARYLDVNLPATRTAFETAGGTLTFLGASWVMGMRNLGLPIELGYALQFASAAFAAATVASIFRQWRRQSAPTGISAPRGIPDDGFALAALGVGAIIATPYIHAYDLVLAAPALLLLSMQAPAPSAGTEPWNSPAAWHRRLIDHGWLLPWAILGWSALKIPMAPALMTVLLVVCWRRIRIRAPAPAQPAPIPPT